MMKALVPVLVLASVAIGAPAPKPPRAPFEIPGSSMAETPLDRLVAAKLARFNLPPAYICSDAVFVRRVYLDCIGTLPTVNEVKQFLEDRDPGKRRALIDKLLEREEFADYWSLKWADLLRVRAEFPINLWPNAVQAYHQWIRDSIREKKPYDRFARELLTSSGSNFRVAPVNFYRAVRSKDAEGILQAVALTFMGMRTENWPEEKIKGLAPVFNAVGYKSTLEWKEEIVFFDTSKFTGAAPVPATALDGTPLSLTSDRDPREVFADWLISPKNPYFAKNIANRVWSWLLGRGIVHEPDDIRPDNPPVNPELLAYLERELINAKWDLRQLFKLILNSRTYQYSAIPRSLNPEVEANFGHYGLRRLEAEVLIDAICQITGTTESYSSPIPEPFTYIPENQRSIVLGDGSITSSFLELFGRPTRDSGMELERNNRVSPGQRLHLLNSSHIRKKLEGSKKLQYFYQMKNQQEAVAGLYMLILSRMPSEEEVATITKYSKSSSAKGREALIDLAWALVNTAEFLYRH